MRQGRRLYPILIIVVLFFGVFAHAGDSVAAPQVSGVSGTVGNGQTITISGSGFGANGPAILLFDDFEGGTNNTALATNLAPLGTWNANNNTTYSRYSNSDHVSGSLAASFLRPNWTDAQPAMIALAPSAFDSFYISYNIKIPAGQVVPGTSGGEGANWKTIWVAPNDNVNDADVTIVNAAGNWILFGNDSPLTSNNDRWMDFQWSTGSWFRISWWERGRTDNTGQVKVWETGPSGTLFDRNLTAQTLNAGDAGKRRYFFVNGYTRDDANSTQLFDDVYIAYGENAQARVEIGDSATYSNCKKITIATSTLWSATSITATVNAGSFSNGDAGYIYVWDANGLVNTTGRQVTFGSGSGDTTPPAAPAGLSVN